MDESILLSKILISGSDVLSCIYTRRLIPQPRTQDHFSFFDIWMVKDPGSEVVSSLLVFLRRTEVKVYYGLIRKRFEFADRSF